MTPRNPNPISFSMFLMTGAAGALGLRAAASSSPASQLERDLNLQRQEALDAVRLSPQFVGEGEGVRLVCISDTHGLHSKLKLPEGDILVHAGDFTMDGGEDEMFRFAKWFLSRPHRHKVLVAGNHDLPLDLSHGCGNRETKARFVETIEENGGHYLENEARLIGGLWFYGSPCQPRFREGWAFQYARGEPGLRIWRQIPECVDVLITHGPAFSRHDLCVSRKRAGCLDLLHEIQNRVRPRVHICGHIHEDHGASSDGTTDFINASSLDVHYLRYRKPILVSLSLSQK